MSIIELSGEELSAGDPETKQNKTKTEGRKKEKEESLKINPTLHTV